MIAGIFINFLYNGMLCSAGLVKTIFRTGLFATSQSDIQEIVGYVALVVMNIAAGADDD